MATRIINGKKDCPCSEWQSLIKTLNGRVHTWRLGRKAVWNKPLGDKWKSFLYCPWCGSKLK